MIEFNPKEIRGSWDQGYVLDVHTISSTMIGYNEFGGSRIRHCSITLGRTRVRLEI